MNSGVNLTLAPRTPAAFQKAGMLSPAGRCRTLDAAADGYTRAEAAVMMLLQASSTAHGPQVVDHGDGAAHILAVLVLRGSGVNQDGRSSALTAPNGPAQQAVIRAALAMGSLPASDVSALQVRNSSCYLKHVETEASQTEVCMYCHAMGCAVPACRRVVPAYATVKSNRNLQEYAEHT